MLFLIVLEVFLSFGQYLNNPAIYLNLHQTVRKGLKLIADKII